MIEFNRVNPAIGQFHSNMSRFGQERRADDEAARTRLTYENAIATDKALRQGIGAIYAEPATGAPPAPLPPQEVAPTQPAPAAPAPTPALGPTTLGPRAPFSAATTEPAPFGEDPRLPLDQQGAAPVTAAAPAAQPTAVRAAPSVRSQFGQVQNALAKAPGTGHSMMQLFSADQTSARAGAVEQRKLEAEGHKMWVAALKEGDVKMAQQIGKQYGLNIPDQIYNDRGMAIDMRVAANMTKTMGITDDRAASFVSKYMEARHNGADQGVAARAAAAAAESIGGKAAHWYVDENRNVVALDAHNNPVAGKGGPKARETRYEMYPPNAGGAGGKQSVFQQKQAAWLALHPSDAAGALEFASGRRQATTFEIQKSATAAAAREERSDPRAAIRGWTPEQRARRTQEIARQFGAVAAMPLDASEAVAAQGLRPPPAGGPAPAAGGGSRLRLNTQTGQLEPVAAAQ